jgi:hypothetical protein
MIRETATRNDFAGNDDVDEDGRSSSKLATALARVTANDAFLDRSCHFWLHPEATI